MTGDEDMKIHRTEMLQAPDGLLSTVRYIGLFEHAGDIREEILQLKYQDKKKQSEILAMKVVNALRDSEFGDSLMCDLVSWAPTTTQRKLKRGFDQSELIARHVAAYLRIKHVSLLRRSNDGRQTGSGREERLARPSFVARPQLQGKHILIFDDVMTTGATLRAAAEALVAAGAKHVTCIAISWVK